MEKILRVSFYVSAIAICASGLPREDDGWLRSLTVARSIDSSTVLQFAGVLDRIKTGLEYATNYLETARNIADLVAKSLDGKQKERRGDGDETREKGNFGPSNVVSAFFRLFGLDSQKVTAIAVNSVIFLAQMVR